MLLVFTSALFAFSQYNENRQTKIIEKEQNTLRDREFGLADKNEGLQDTKKMWEGIVNFKPSTNHGVAFALMVLLVLYVISFAVGMSASWCSANNAICAAVNHAIRVFSIFLMIMSIVIFIQWWRMNGKLKDFRKKVENFNLVYGTVTKAILSNSKKKDEKGDSGNKK